MNIQGLELLSPAGSYEGFLAAIHAGADAVYAGGLKFGARAFAQNFSEEEFLKAIDYAHIRGKKLYMTVNTLCKEREREDLIHYLRPYYMQGLDGVIVQDIGVISMIRDYYPDLPIHGSTQMSIANSEGARLLQSMGVSRVVPARELSLSEIRTIHEDTGIEIEAFIHGAMCYSYSGQCLFSSMLGGRSGNRGRCAQPCRLAYSCELNDSGHGIGGKQEEYLLSMKDLCTISILPDIIENHVTSFKIEGRMKQPEYTAAVTSIYRKYIDLYLSKGASDYTVERRDLDLLTHSFSRIDPKTGYYYIHNGRELITLEKPGYEQGSEGGVDQYTGSKDTKIPTVAYCNLLLDEPASLTLIGDEFSVTVYGDVCQKAMKSALDESAVRKQISKFGDSDFALEELHIELSNDVFLPVKALNELRRNAIHELTESVIEKYHRNEEPFEKIDAQICNDTLVKPSKLNGFSVLCETMEQVSAVFEYLHDKKSSSVNRIYIESSLLASSKADFSNLLTKYNDDLYKRETVQMILSLPYVFRKKDRDILKKVLEQYGSCFDGFLVRTFDEIEYAVSLRRKDQILISDFNLYSFNQYAAKTLVEKGIDILTYPLELNFHELKERGYSELSELLVYGKIPMMISAGCVPKTMKSCRKAYGSNENDLYDAGQKHESGVLIDRYHKRFPMISDCVFCYNRILNAFPISLHNDISKIDSLSPAWKRIQFSTEDGEMVERILSLIDADQFENLGDFLPDYTKGHFKKSVE